MLVSLLSIFVTLLLLACYILCSIGCVAGQPARSHCSYRKTLSPDIVDGEFETIEHVSKRSAKKHSGLMESIRNRMRIQMLRREAQKDRNERADHEKRNEQPSSSRFSSFVDGATVALLFKTPKLNCFFSPIQCSRRFMFRGIRI